MPFKVPPSNLAWLCALWAILGAYVSYSSFATGDNYMGGVSLLFCFAGVLVWLDFREVAWPLMIWFGVVIASAVLLLILKGVTLRPITAIAMAGFTIYELKQWHQSE